MITLQPTLSHDVSVGYICHLVTRLAVLCLKSGCSHLGAATTPQARLVLVWALSLRRQLHSKFRQSRTSTILYPYQGKCQVCLVFWNSLHTFCHQHCFHAAIAPFRRTRTRNHSRRMRYSRWIFTADLPLSWVRAPCEHQRRSPNNDSRPWKAGLQPLYGISNLTRRGKRGGSPDWNESLLRSVACPSRIHRYLC